MNRHVGAISAWLKMSHVAQMDDERVLYHNSLCTIFIQRVVVTLQRHQLKINFKTCIAFHYNVDSLKHLFDFVHGGFMMKFVN